MTCHLRLSLCTCRSVGSVNSVLSSLVSQGKVQNDNGTYRFVSSGGSRSATPTAVRPSSATRAVSPAARPVSPAARAPTPTAGPGTGASSGDEATVLSVLSNYAGLTSERLSSMLRNSGK